MRTENFNRDVNLLEIARRGNAVEKSGGLRPDKTRTDNFSRELADACRVNFSRHARERLFSRCIELSDSKLTQIAQAIDKAETKGSRETLILDDNSAYVVSVPTRTVVTAFGKEHLREGVVTSIDSAIVL